MPDNDQRIENLKAQIEKLSCDVHHFVIRRRLASNNVPMFKRQCTRCGELTGGWIPHCDIRIPESIDPIDDDLRERYNKSKQELTNALNDRIRELEKRDFFVGYSDYLASAEWDKRRKLVLKRCARICEGCGINVASQVHHLSYGNVGNEFLFELVGLCSDCHKRIHPE